MMSNVAVGSSILLLRYRSSVATSSAFELGGAATYMRSPLNAGGGGLNDETAVQDAPWSLDWNSLNAGSVKIAVMTRAQSRPFRLARLTRNISAGGVNPTPRPSEAYYLQVAPSLDWKRPLLVWALV